MKMPIDLNMVYLAIALLLAPALGEIGKVRARADKGFAWIAAGGASYLLAAAFGNEFWPGLGATLSYGSAIFGVIGLILTLVGAISVLTSSWK